MSASHYTTMDGTKFIITTILHHVRGVTCCSVSFAHLEILCMHCGFGKCGISVVVELSMKEHSLLSELCVATIFSYSSWSCISWNCWNKQASTHSVILWQRCLIVDAGRRILTLDYMAMVGTFMDMPAKSSCRGFVDKLRPVTVVWPK